MRKEDLKNWTREQMKSEILRLHRKLELFGIKFEEHPNNFSFFHNGNRYYAGKLVNDYAALKEENTELKERVKEQREKIDSLLKELEEEKGKAITISDGAITMRADMWEMLNENKALEDENKSLKQQNDYLMNIFENAYIPESAESMIRKAGLSDEVIDDARKRIESLEKELKAENTALKQRIKDLEDVCYGSCISDEEDKRDKMISELQDQHQQDCIKINQLHVTIDTLVDKYSRLRKTVGVD